MKRRRPAPNLDRARQLLAPSTRVPRGRSPLTENLVPRRYVSPLLPDPGIEVGPYRILPRADSQWVVYDERLPVGARTVAALPSKEEATARARELIAPPSEAPTRPTALARLP